MKMRKHQNELKIAIEQKLAESSGGPLRDKFLLAAVAPGGGKSSLPAIAMKLLNEAGVCDSLAIVTPRESLQQQAAEDFENQFFRDLIGHQFSINEATNEVNPSRGLSGYVTTYQAIGADQAGINYDEFRRRRMLLCLDEVHHVAEGSNWHKRLKLLVDEAAFVLLMTGTLERGDNQKIAFLPYKEEI